MASSLDLTPGTLMGDDKVMISLKVSYTSNNDESKSRTVKKIAGSFEQSKKPLPSKSPEDMEEDGSDPEKLLVMKTLGDKKIW